MLYILLWSPYTYLVSLDTFKQIQQYKVDLTVTVYYYFIFQWYKGDYIIFYMKQKDAKRTSTDHNHATRLNS